MKRDKANRRTTLLTVTLVFAILTLPTEAGFFSFVKKPFKWVGDGIGFVAKNTIGRAIKGAADPTINGTADKMKEVIHTANVELDTTLSNRVQQVDEVLKARIDQVDKMMKNRIDQVDNVLDERIKQASAAAQDVLNRQEQIWNSALDRQAAILDLNMGRLEGLVTNTLSRVETLTEDKIPYAASRVMRELQWAFFFGVLTLVFVGFGGFYVFKSLNALPPATPVLARSRQALVSGLSNFRSAFPVIFIIAVLVQLAYWGYCTATDWRHRSKLEKRAELAEQEGDFIRAAAFRLRVYELSPGNEKKYFAVRDQYLAKFIHGRSSFTPNPVQNLLDVQPIYAMLRSSFPREAANDPNLEALELYSRVRILTFIKLNAQSDPSQSNVLQTASTSLAEVQKEVSEYRRKHFSFFSRKPLLGRHALMAEVLLKLGDESLSFQERLRQSRQLADAIADGYSDYAPGRMLRAQLTAMHVEIAELSPTSVPRSKRDTDVIERDVNYVSVLDKDYANLAILVDMGLDESSAEAFFALHSNSNAVTKAAAEAAITVAYERFKTQAQLVFANERYANVIALPRFYEAVSRNVEERSLKDMISQTRTGGFKTTKSPEDLAKFFKQVAESAERLGNLVLAEVWLTEAERLAAQTGFPGATKKEIAMKKAKMKENSLAQSLVMLF